MDIPRNKYCWMRYVINFLFVLLLTSKLYCYVYIEFWIVGWYVKVAKASYFLSYYAIIMPNWNKFHQVTPSWHYLYLVPGSQIVYHFQGNGLDIITGHSITTTERRHFQSNDIFFCEWHWLHTKTSNAFLSLQKSFASIWVTHNHL